MDTYSLLFFTYLIVEEPRFGGIVKQILIIKLGNLVESESVSACKTDVFISLNWSYVSSETLTSINQVFDGDG